MIFWFVGNPFGNVLKITPEVYLGHGISIDIAQRTVASGAKNALFGSGPTMFSNQYKLHRTVESNSSPFWNLRFDSGSGAITSFFATAGVLGGGSMFIFAMWFVWFCIRFLFKQSQNPQLTSGVLLGGIYFLLAWVLYTTNFMLLFAGFLFVALWAGTRGRRKIVAFHSSPALMFWGMKNEKNNVVIGCVFTFN